MKIALIGDTGYVGTEFNFLIQARQFELATIGRQTCDVDSVDDLTTDLRRTGADAAINCAGYTGEPNVDACETDKANCLAGNAVLPGVIAEACQRLELPQGHVSSGCIFTGKMAEGGKAIRAGLHLTPVAEALRRALTRWHPASA